MRIRHARYPRRLFWFVITIWRGLFFHLGPEFILFFFFRKTAREKILSRANIAPYPRVYDGNKSIEVSRWRDMKNARRPRAALTIYSEFKSRVVVNG